MLDKIIIDAGMGDFDIPKPPNSTFWQQKVGKLPGRTNSLREQSNEKIPTGVVHP